MSKWQGTVDWSLVAASGKRFIIMKATEGTGYVDPMFATNYAGAKAAGLRVTAYHFAAPDKTPGEAVAEANHFVDVAGLVDGDLVPALDLEVTGSMGPAALTAWVKAFLDQVTVRLGQQPMIYVSPSFWSTKVANTTAFAAAGYKMLWIAHWGVSSPTVPAQNWGGNSWTFWQYSNCGHVPGISGCVDLDRFNGTDLETAAYHPGFRISASPGSLVTKQGRSITSKIAIERTNFPNDVVFAVDGLPPGTTATFSPNPATGTSKTLPVMTTNVGTATATGSYPLTITGVGAGLTRTTYLNLIVTDGNPPVVVPPTATFKAGSRLGTSTASMRIGWPATDESGIASYRVQRQINGGSWSTVSLAKVTSSAVNQSLTIGTKYRYRVQATDKKGNVSAWTYGRAFQPVLIQQNSTLLKYHGRWTTAALSGASGGTLRYATSAGAWVSYKFSGGGVAWVAYTGPGRGFASVYLDGVLVKTVNLRSAKVSTKAITYSVGWATHGIHTLQVVVAGTAGRPRVDTDAFLRLRLY